MKTCSTCKEQKSLIDFYKGHGKCKRCVLNMQKEKYKKSAELREIKKTASRLSYQLNKSTKEFKQKAAKRSEKWRLLNQDKIKKYRTSNRDFELNRLRKWRSDNPEKVVEQNRRSFCRRSIYWRYQSENLTDVYISNSFDMPKQLINDKREQLFIYRLKQQIKQAIHIHNWE